MLGAGSLGAECWVLSAGCSRLVPVLSALGAVLRHQHQALSTKHRSARQRPQNGERDAGACGLQPQLRRAPAGRAIRPR